MAFDFVDDHLERMEQALFNTYDITDAARWIVDNTFLKGDKFSFLHHEYQLEILSDPSRIVNVQKPAQIGMSELMGRYALALCSIIPGFSTIITFPFSGDAENFMKTRIDPIIDGSPVLKASLDGNLDNSEIKGILTSLLYARGTSGTTAALSIPADLLIHDELDKSDKATIGQYQSRIRHSNWKLVRRFGTPTIEKRGISLEIANSRRKSNLCKCKHCSTWYKPSYFDHVRIPGWDRDLSEITKDNIRGILWQEARLRCPRCGRNADLSLEYREWNFENAQDNYEAVGYLCSPFDVPNMTSTPELVLESTKYEYYGEFMNQGLGLTAKNDKQQLTETDILNCLTTHDLNSGNVHCLGADMGIYCHLWIGRLQGMSLICVYREIIHMSVFEKRRLELMKEYKVIISVCDAFPYTDMVLRMQTFDKNLYGAVYNKTKTLSTFSVKMVDENKEDGKLPINQVLVNRDTALDDLMGMFKNNQIIWAAKDVEDHDKVVKQLTDMTRVQAFDRVGDMSYIWEKAEKADDHYHHGLLYLFAACKLMGTVARNGLALPASVPLITSFPVKDYQKVDQRTRFFGNRR